MLLRFHPLLGSNSTGRLRLRESERPQLSRCGDELAPHLPEQHDRFDSFDQALSNLLLLGDTGAGCDPPNRFLRQSPHIRQRGIFARVGRSVPRRPTASGVARGSLEIGPATPRYSLRIGETITVAPWKGTVPFSSDENRDSPPVIRSPILKGRKDSVTVPRKTSAENMDLSPSRDARGTVPFSRQ
jgi:hypothetical protein